MKRVLHLIDHSGLGGAQRIIMGLQSQELDGWFFASLSPGKRTFLKKLDFQGSGKRTYLNSYRELRTLIIRNNIGVLHCHLLGALILGLVIKFTTSGVHLVYHEHGRVLFSNRCYGRLLRFVSKYGTIVTINEQMALRIPIKRVEVFQNPVWLPKGIGRVTYPWLLPNVPVVGFAGRLAYEKGWDVFLEALVPFLREKEVIAVIAGSGPDKKAINEKIQEKEVSEGVFLAGMVDSMYDWYQSLDFFVFPSRDEPGGLVHLEAQLMGIPCLVSDVPGIRSTIIEKGSVIWVNQDEPIQNLRKGIRSLLDNKQLRASLVEKGFANVRHFQIEPYTQNLLNFYSDL